MIHLLKKIPDDVTVACSGGSDSMAVLNFLNNGHRKIRVAHFDHGTYHGHDATLFVQRYCENNNIPLTVNSVLTSQPVPRGRSKEEFWRDQRYQFFSEIDGPVITAHHLDDVVEWWIFSSLHGQSKLIPYKNKNVIRPFLLTTKNELLSWVENKNVKYITDPSNKDTKYMRNLIRHQMMHCILEVNPGIQTTLKKKLINKYSKEEENSHG